MSGAVSFAQHYTREDAPSVHHIPHQRGREHSAERAVQGNRSAQNATRAGEAHPEGLGGWGGGSSPAAAQKGFLGASEQEYGLRSQSEVGRPLPIDKNTVKSVAFTLNGD